jgi:hypothetical protein
VPGGSAGQQASELYNVLLRASDWVDLICFHGPDGTLAASPTIQSGWGGRHEYDHADGYDGDNQLRVEPVCQRCHRNREELRLAR